ncbi:MAG: ATP-binding protein [Rhodothermales bacterium]
MKGGIASRLAIIFSLLVFVATATVGFLVFWGARQALTESSTERLEHSAETVEVRFAASLEAISKDVLFLAETPPVPGLIRAYDDGWLDRVTNHNIDEWSEQLAGIFTVFLQNRPSYIQARYIGLADAGRELVRVERRSGQVHRTPAAALQQRGEQRYFTAAVNLPPGDVYLSEIDLDQEEGDVAQPGVPTLRAATPVYDAGGNAFGILIIDVDFRYALRTLQSLVDPAFSLYLANDEGEYLLHPDSTQIAGVDSSSTRALIQHHFPEIAAWFASARASVPGERTEAALDRAVFPHFDRVSFNNEQDPHFLVLAVTAPQETILSGVTKVRNSSLLITVLFALWGIVLALVFSHYLTRPLRKITRALSHFGRDRQPIDLPVRRKDEIGVLARTYDTMAQQIQVQIEELEDKAHRQRIILETSAEGLIVTDAQGNIETINRAAERIFGYTAEEVTGQNVNMLVYRDAEELSGNGAAPATDVEQWNQLGNGHEVTGRRKDGTTFPLSLALSSFELAGEKKYAGFLQDITRRKQYEQKLREAKRTAEAANTAKSAFLANMSHEIRTPLTGIIGFASLLARQVTGKHRKYAQLIESSGVRLKETLNSVLDLAKLEAKRVEVKLGVLKIRDEVQEVVQLFQAQAQQKALTLTFEVEPGGEEASARLDRGAFSSIMQNLLGNAVKFTDEGGVAVVLGADEDRAYVRVQDTGVGIDASFMPHLFDVFRQESTGLSRTHEGSGLGLSITQRLVALMDGEIAVESEKGEGSTFTVSFPLVPFEEAIEVFGVTEDVKPAPLLDGLKKSRMLLVEDNENTQYLIESLLENEYELTIVANAEEALLQAFNTEYDIILMDINLGEGANGADVLRELRAMPAYRDVPIAALTAYALPGDRERFLEMGFTAYLSKPFNADELLDLTARL